MNPWEVLDALIREVQAQGIIIAPGMPIPEDERHLAMATDVMRGLLTAHREGRHTAFCRCKWVHRDS